MFKINTGNKHLPKQTKCDYIRENRCIIIIRQYATQCLRSFEMHDKPFYEFFPCFCLFFYQKNIEVPCLPVLFDILQHIKEIYPCRDVIRNLRLNRHIRVRIGCLQKHSFKNRAETGLKAFKIRALFFLQTKQFFHRSSNQGFCPGIILFRPKKTFPNSPTDNPPAFLPVNHIIIELLILKHDADCCTVLHLLVTSTFLTTSVPLASAVLV